MSDLFGTAHNFRSTRFLINMCFNAVIVCMILYESASDFFVIVLQILDSTKSDEIFFFCIFSLHYSINHSTKNSFLLGHFASFTISSYTCEPVHEKTNNLGFRPGPTQSGLCSHRRWLEAGNFGF